MSENFDIRHILINNFTDFKLRTSKLEDLFFIAISFPNRTGILLNFYKANSKY